MKKKSGTLDDIATEKDVDAHIDSIFVRLELVKDRLGELSWDNDSDDLRFCLIQLDAVIQGQADFRRVMRRRQRFALDRVESKILKSHVSKSVN